MKKTHRAQRNMKPAMRTERDSLGEKEVPRDAYYGVQTARAIENFPVSGLRPDPEFIRATVMVKRAAATANMATGSLEKKIGKAILRAADEVIRDQWHDQFVVDPYQAGAGTSHNMNANEVIANRALEILGCPRGTYSVIHPNDHVNMSQSTNDVFPTAMRIATLLALPGLSSAAKNLSAALARKGKEFDGIIKSGRTHLQDAVPIRLGQEFSAYALTITKMAARITAASRPLSQLGIGGTAAGTGINTHPQYRTHVVKALREISGLGLSASESMVEAMQSMADFVHISGALRELAIELIRIANDLRLLSSGPRTGLAEIVLPPVQPGSSIMPGKVNPVMAEVLNMVCFQVVGNDTAVTLAVQAGQLELNVMMPVIVHNVLTSIRLLTNVLTVFTERCVKGITANVEACRKSFETSVGLATVLNPYIGYEAAASLAKEAFRTGRPVRELIIEKGILSPEKVAKIFDPANLT